MMLLLIPFIFMQTPAASSDASDFLWKIGGGIILAIIGGVMTYFKTQNDRRYNAGIKEADERKKEMDALKQLVADLTGLVKGRVAKSEFDDLKEQTGENTSAIKENTIYDKNRNEKFDSHEKRMAESEKSIKDFLTEYKRDQRTDWRDFKKEVKEEISLLRKEINDNKK